MAKLDPDLVREILEAIEDLPAGTTAGCPCLEDRDLEETRATLSKLMDAGLVAGVHTRTSGGGWAFMVEGLTLDGDRFVEAARDPGRWAKLKDSARAAAGFVGIETLKAFARSIVG